MISLKYKDIKNRKKFFREELKLKALKYFYINSLHSNTKAKSKLLFFYLKETQKISKTILQSRCVLTNRPKVSYRKFRISRIKLREMLKFNIFPGYKRAIW